MPDYFNVGAFRNVGSWHGKEVSSGGIFTGRTTIWEQMLRSGMDYEVAVSPSYYTWNEEFIEVPGKYHVVVPRTSFNPTPRSIRQIGNRYEVLQNSRIAEIMEPIQEYYPLEGLGVLKDGKVVFVEFKMEPFDVGGNSNETHESYLMLSNDHSYGSAFFGETYTRVVCANTYAMALGDDRIASIPHSVNVDEELNFRAEVIHNAIQSRKSHKEMLDRMFVTPVVADDLKLVVEATFPDPKKPRSYRVYNSVDPLGLDQNSDVIANMAEKAESDMETWERSVERQNELRTDIAEAFIQFNDEQPYCANTAYALWNSASQVVNHSPRFYGSADKQMVSLFFGQKNTMLQNAWKVCTELIN